MKARMFCVLVVFALVTVSFAQKPREVAALIIVDPMSVTLGEKVNIQLFVTNTGSRSVTIREVELYCGTSTPDIWEEWGTFKRVTVEPGEMISLPILPYKPSCEGEWKVQAWMCFGGGGKSDLMTPLTTFTVERPLP